MVFVDQLEIGPMQNYVYFVGDTETREVAVVDPAWDVPHIIKEAESRDYTISAMIFTHAHPDHANGISDLYQWSNMPIYVQESEAGMYGDYSKDLKAVKDEEEFSVGKTAFKVLHTPGHTQGGMCLVVGENLISGDTLFLDCCGRVDLPGSSAADLFKSLQNKIMPLPETLTVYPGHNYHPLQKASLGEVKKMNPYLGADAKELFFGHHRGF